jgi:hydrogenase maturation protease
VRAAPALVVGLGSVDRGDDGIGPVVAAHVGTLDLPHVRVATHEDPTSLVELMAGFDTVVVVDAMRSRAPAGTVTTLHAGAGRPPIGARMDPGPAGTHGLGLAMAIELARVLGRLPEHVDVVAVEADTFEHGTGLSAAVAAAVPVAVAAVLGSLRVPMAAGE